jgi:hypothetical protein
LGWFGSRSRKEKDGNSGGSGGGDNGNKWDESGSWGERSAEKNRPVPAWKKYALEKKK